MMEPEFYPSCPLILNIEEISEDEPFGIEHEHQSNQDIEHDFTWAFQPHGKRGDLNSDKSKEEKVHYPVDYEESIVPLE